MIDLIVAYLASIVVVLLFIVAFMTIYIVYERHQSVDPSTINEKNVIVPLFALKTSAGSSGDNSNASIVYQNVVRLKKRVRK